MGITANIDDRQIVEQLKDGSKDAFRLIYDRYGIKIYRFALSYLKSEHDAEELVQEVFLKLWDKREKLNSLLNIQAFIYKIAVNSIYDFIRRKNVEQAFLSFAEGKTELTDETWQEIIFNDMLAQINSLMEKMPEQRRKIFKMSKENGLSNDEIAVTLGLSKRTVENQIYRATAFLKENLKLDSSFSLLFFYLFCQ